MPRLPRNFPPFPSPPSFGPQSRVSPKGPCFPPPPSPASDKRIFPPRQSRRQTVRHNSAASQSFALQAPRCPPLPAARAAPAKRPPQSSPPTSPPPPAPPPPTAPPSPSPHQNTPHSQQPATFFRVQPEPA